MKGEGWRLAVSRLTSGFVAGIRVKGRLMTAKLELSLLGTVAITLNGERVSGQIPAKSQALLCYLAVTGRRHSREKLAGLLWGDKPEARAKASLRKSLSDLRQLFGDALIITRQTVAFNRDSDLLAGCGGF